jgi:sugar phosphate isomerase/epimerase
MIAARVSSRHSRRMQRRQFLTTTVAAAAASLLHAETLGKKRRNPFCVFTKPFQSLSYDDLADLIAELGFDGIEGTIRPGGHITPEQVPDELPKMVEALRKRKLELTIMASGINNADDKLNVQQLQVAAKLGVKRYRMGYYKYDLKRPVAKQLDEFRPILKNLVALNKELGIQAIYQNHSGSNYVGAPMWDLHELFKAHDPAHVSVGFDLSHAKAEAMRSWPLSANLLRPRIGALYVKSFRWDNNQRKNCSLAEGIVDKKYPRQLIASGFTGPINLHEEYLNHRDPKLIPQHVAAIRKDIVTLKSWLGWK